MPESNPLFHSENIVSDTLGRGALKRLVRQKLMLSVTKAGSDHKYLTCAFEQIDRNPHRLLLDQPPHDGANRNFFESGDEIRLQWSEQGIRSGAYAEVQQVTEEKGAFAYEVQVMSEVYRQQRREALRMPASLGELRAELRAQDDGSALPATIKDLSATGVRFSLDSQQAVNAGISEDQHATLNLMLDQEASPLSSELCIVWAARADAGITNFGASWVPLSSDFTKRVQNFVVQKERALLKWLSGRD